MLVGHKYFVESLHGSVLNWQFSWESCFTSQSNHFEPLSKTMLDVNMAMFFQTPRMRPWSLKSNYCRCLLDCSEIILIIEDVADVPQTFSFPWGISRSLPQAQSFKIWDSSGVGRFNPLAPPCRMYSRSRSKARRLFMQRCVIQVAQSKSLVWSSMDLSTENTDLTTVSTTLSLQNICQSVIGHDSSIESNQVKGEITRY